MFTKFTKALVATTLTATVLVSAAANATTLSRSQAFGALSPSANATITRTPDLFLPPLLNIQCAVAGTPVEFPNDIQIWSSTGVDAGTSVAWSVQGFSGTTVLPALGPNETAFLSNVLPGGAPAGLPCVASAN